MTIAIPYEQVANGGEIYRNLRTENQVRPRDKTRDAGEVQNGTSIMRAVCL
jgi:hypothetical protein